MTYYIIYTFDDVIRLVLIILTLPLFSALIYRILNFLPVVLRSINRFIKSPSLIYNKYTEDTLNDK